MALTAWIYNSNTGTVLVLEPIEAQAIVATGSAWHGLFHSADEVNRYYAENKAAHPQWKAPTGNPITQAGNTVDAAQAKAQQAVSSVTSGWTAAINTVVKLVPRVLEAAVGIVLLAVAANAILKAATGVDVGGGALHAGERAAGLTPPGRVARVVMR